jgi:hypothetical protein
MGYDLSNSSGTYVRFTGSGWDLALAIARHYGWESAGIPKPSTWDEKEYGPWEDEYWMNAGQQVTEEDAASLTAALDRAVVAPDFVEAVMSTKGDLTREQAESFKARLVEFAGLSRQGPFIIR